MNEAINGLKRASATARAFDDGAAAHLLDLVLAVRRFHAEQRYAPSIGDLAAALGWSKMRARDSVRALLESGHLIMSPGVGHSLRVAQDEERLQARSVAWYSALRGLPAIEVAAAAAALARLNGGA